MKKPASVTLPTEPSRTATDAGGADAPAGPAAGLAPLPPGDAGAALAPTGTAAAGALVGAAAGAGGADPLPQAIPANSAPTTAPRCAQRRRRAISQPGRAAAIRIACSF